MLQNVKLFFIKLMLVFTFLFIGLMFTHINTSISDFQFNHICEIDNISKEIIKLCSLEYFNQFYNYTDLLYLYLREKSINLEINKFNSIVFKSGWNTANMFDFRYLKTPENFDYVMAKHTIESNCDRIQGLLLEQLLGFNWENKVFFNGQSYIEGAEFYWVDRELTPQSVTKLYEIWEKVFIVDANYPSKPWNVLSPYLIYDFAEKQLYWDIHEMLTNNFNYIKYKSSILNFFLSNKEFIEFNSTVPTPDDFFFDLSAATVYYTSEPNFKCFIPYPFVASGNYVHHDYWWLHITVYYYWLWFFFIFLIIFFFISFLWEIEHNITKNLPQRETRGVSRSKCGDLITAIIPISWATAIIIHESTDSIDTFDGFGTLEFVVGIRAYQWGWEYYYPNSLKNNITNSNDKNILTGNSNFFITNNNESITKENNNNILLNKNQDYNILPIFAITNSNINKEVFSINKMSNFGFSKLCIFNAYKFSLNNKSLNYSNILNSTINLTNFNSKKYINTYNINTTDIDSNITQSKIALLSTKLKLFKKFYNFSDIKYYKNVKLSDFSFNFNIKEILNNYNFLTIYNFLVFKSSIRTENTLNNIKIVNFDYSKYINLENLIYKKINSNFNANIINLNTNFNFKNSYNMYLNNIYLNNSYLNNLNAKNIFFFKNIDINYALNKKINLFNIYTNCDFFKISYFGDLSFRRVDTNEILEDMYWDFYFNDQNIISQSNNGLYFYKFNKYLFKFYGHYEKDKELYINNIYENNYWYNNYLNIKIVMNLDNIYNNKINNKDVSLISKLNLLMDNSFLINKFFYNNPIIGLIDVNNFFNNFLNSNIIMSSLYKYPVLNLITKDNNKFVYDNFNIKFNPNFVLNDNAKIIFSNVNSVWKTFKTNVFDNRFYFNKNNLNFNTYDNFILLFNNENLSQLINKNLTSFFEVINFNKIHFKYFNSLFTKFFYLKNLTSYELPFSLSSESDSFKYNWIDWYIPYSKRESKFIDITQYNLNGSKLFFNKYDYYYNDINELNLLDNYYTRLLNNKKNFINSFNYVPFLLLKNNNNLNSYSLNNLILNFNEIRDTLKFNLLLNYTKSFDKVIILNFIKNNNLLSFNNFFTDSKNFFFSINDFNSFYSYISILNNILIRRNFLMKQLVINNLNFTDFDNYNISIKNNIVLEWKSSLLKSNKQDIEKNINKYFIQNFLLLKNDMKVFNNLLSKILTYNFIDSYFYFSNNIYLNNSLISYISKLSFLDNFKIINTNSNNKSQYNHMKKSVSNMIRLQPTKSISLPTDTKIQILAWSKDIIHSWAIPSAGIKIDCIPGYSSHKVFNITLTGVYYGQCMEICGRFHHWMPIVVYFLKKDLFLLWCLNVLYNKKLNYLNNNKKLKNSTNFCLLK